MSVEVFAPVLALSSSWQHLPDHVHDDALVQVRTWGFRDEPEGLFADAAFVVRAVDEQAARECAGGLIDQAIAAAPGVATGSVRVLRLDANPQRTSVPSLVEAVRAASVLESRVVPVPWHRSEPTPDALGLKIVWFGGPCPLERVGVDEAVDRVTITLFERMPGIVPAVGCVRGVEVRLDSVVGDRAIYDGSTGERPADIVPGNYRERLARTIALDVDLATFATEPLPPKTTGQ
jgi:hypothetical protein